MSDRPRPRRPFSTQFRQRHRGRNVVRVTLTTTLHYADGSSATLVTWRRAGCWPGGWALSSLGGAVREAMREHEAKTDEFCTVLV